MHKENTGDTGKKDEKKIMGTERKGKFTKLIYTLNPKSIVLGIDRCN